MVELCVKILTLIPEADTYGLIVLIALSLGSTGIASYIYMRYLSIKANDIILTNAIVKIIIVLFGLLIIPFSQLYSQNWQIEISSIPIGIIFGFIVISIDKKVIRHFIRTGKHSVSIDMNTSADRLNYNKTYNRSLGLDDTVETQDNSLKMQNNMNRLSSNPELVTFSLGSVILVAICEEIIFRGFLVSCSLMIHDLKLRVVALIASVLFFGISHATSGLEQALTKTILGTITLLLRMISGSILPAIVTHVVLNTAAYYETKRIRSGAVLNNTRSSSLRFSN